MRRKAVAVLLALVMAVFALTGCTKTQQGTITLYDGNGLKIEREGVETRIYDLEGEAEYTFTSHRVRKSAVEPVKEAQTTTDTDTITIQTVHGLIIVTSKATGTTLYIKGATVWQTQPNAKTSLLYRHLLAIRQYAQRLRLAAFRKRRYTPA